MTVGGTASIGPQAEYRLRRQSTLTFLLFHLLLPLAALPWLFSWTGVLSVFVGHYLFCSVGISLCFHRTLCHRSLRLPSWLERTCAILGTCSLQDSPCHWVAIHRLHHHHTDDDDDPHCPLKSLFWAHMGWLLVKRSDRPRHVMYERYAPDLIRDPFYARLERNTLWFYVFVLHAAGFVVAGMLAGWVQTGTLIGAVRFGLSLFVWGVVVRVVFSWHTTWAVNSLAHASGYRNYETGDNSRNNWLVALATNGEGWHNNHHADQRSAGFGHRWWELDVIWLTILLLKRLRLARDVIPPQRRIAADVSHEAGHTARAA